MRKKEKFFVLTFATTEDALQAEAFCREQGISGRLIPTPQSISAGCGLAWRTMAEAAAPLKEQLEKLAFEAACEIEM